MSLTRKPIYAQRRVVTAEYLADHLGRLRPQRPSRCCIALPGDNCRIKWNGYRVRKCGVGYPLAMAYCRPHRDAFTVYPPGWTPFLRRIIVHVSPAGFDVAPSGAGLDDWSDTACGAAVDASKSELWPQSGSGVQAWRLKYKRDPYGVARTQRRHIAGINLLFAVSTSNLNEQAAVVAAIGVDLSAIVQAAGRVRDGPSLVAEGSKGADILRSLGRPSRRLLPGITRLGISREYWGPQADKNNQR